MPKKCMMPKCNCNYATGDKTTIYSFPKEED
jgi:hypothetical protein